MGLPRSVVNLNDSPKDTVTYFRDFRFPGRLGEIYRSDNLLRIESFPSTGINDVGVHFQLTLTSAPLLLQLNSAFVFKGRELHRLISCSQLRMNKLLVLTLFAVLLLSTVEAQRGFRRNEMRGGPGGRGSGGPSGIRYPTEEEERGRGRPVGEGFHVGRWPGGFYGGN